MIRNRYCSSRRKEAGFHEAGARPRSSGGRLQPEIHFAYLTLLTLTLSYRAPAQSIEYNFDPSGNLVQRSAEVPAPPQILAQPQNQVVQPGLLASFSVLLADSTGCAYQWLWYGTNLAGATADTLLVPNVVTNNQGPYSVVVTNLSGSVTSSVAQLWIDSRGCGMPDWWQLAYFGNLNQNSTGDYDGDGISNLQEFLDGTNPTNRNSFRSRLTVFADGGVVSVIPEQTSYAVTDTVTLTGTPIPPNAFFAWSGDLVTHSNPASLLMATNKTVRGCFLCQPAVAGLVGWWRGEGDATDFVGNHNGTFYNGTTNILAPSITPTGMVGSAFMLYGTNYVQAADTNDLRPAQFTLMAWVYPSAQNGNYQTVIAKGSAVNDDDAYYLGVINGGASFWTKNNGGMSQIAGGSVPANQWTHLAATFDGSTKRLYVNGLLVSAQSGFGPITYDPQAIPVTIGSDWTANAPSYLFNGLLDEVSLFNRALNTPEVMGLYIANAAGTCTNRPIFTSSPQFAAALQNVGYTQQVTTVLGALPVSYSLSAGSLPAGLSLSPSGLVSGVPTTPGSNVFAILATDTAGLSAELICGLQVLAVPPQVPTMPAGIVSWWRAENNALDSIGTNNGTLSNGVSFAAGEVGQAFQFSGATNQQVKLLASPSLNVGPGSGFTVEMWIKPATLTNAYPVAEWNDGATYGSHFWANVGGNGQTTPGYIYANLRDVNLTDHYFASPSIVLTTSSWQHVALTYDTSSGIGQLFVNGTVVAYAGLGVFTPRTASNFYLGFRPAPSQFSYAGLMDEAALYNRALSTNEIAAIYYAGPLGKISTGPYINTLSNLADGVITVGYTQAIAIVSSAGPPVTCTLAGGALPPGINLSPAGVLNGIPTTVGSYSFSVTATDTNNVSNSGGFSIQVYAPVPPPAGLIGWWRGESNAVDQLGLHNGTLQGNATYGPGRVGTAFKLDGNNSYVDLGAWSAGSNWTLEAWVKPAGLPGGRRTIFGTMANCYDWGLVIYNGILGAYIRIPGGCTAFVSSGVVPNLNSWYHLVETYDGYTAAVYVNGVLGGTLAGQPNYIGDPSGLRLGSAYCCGEYFPGSIDEAAIYNRPLTPAEIAGLYAAGAAGKTTTGPAFATPPTLPRAVIGIGYTQAFAAARGTLPVSFAFTGGSLPPGLNLAPYNPLSGIPTSIGTFSFNVTATDSNFLSATQAFTLQVLPRVTPTAGLVSWWRAESNALDAIGSNNGFLINSATFAPGKVGQAFSLNGISDAVEFLDSPSLRPTSLTIECWVMFLSAGGTQSIIAKALGGGTADSYTTWLQNGYLYGMVSDINGNNSPIGIPFTPYAGQWYHVAFTFDDSTKQQILYLNGAAVASSVFNVSVGYDNHPLYLGADVNNSSLGIFLQGRIDEAAIYNRALSPAEIAAIYAADAGGKALAGPYFTTAPALPDAAYGLGYNQSITTTRGTPNVTYAMTGGSLPLGLTLNSQGLISGTPTNFTAVVPTNAVTYSFTVTATDAAGLTAVQPFSVRVVPPVPPPAGLISWWRAENNALDSAGTNNGTLLNATLYAPGEVGQAFAFDGFSDAVMIPDSPSLRPASVTLETWVRFDVNSGTQVFFTKPLASGTLDSYSLWLQGGYLEGGISSVNGFGPILAASFTPTVEQWYHVAYTFDDLTRQQVLYLNNVTAASGLADRAISYDTNAVLLGCDSDNGSRTWFTAGRVDEASIYNRALTAAEITALYYAGVAGKTTVGPYFTADPPLRDGVVNQAYTQTLTSVRGTLPVSYTVSAGTTPPGLGLAANGLLSGAPTTPGIFSFTARVTDATGLWADQAYPLHVYAPVQAPAGLKVWYRGENNALDSAGTNNGTLFSVSFASGKVGQAFVFNGTNSFVAISNSSWLNPTGAFSVELWVNANPQQFYTPFLLVDKMHGFTDGTGWAMQGNSDGTVSFFFGNGVNSSPSSFIGAATQTSVWDGHWHHLVGVYNGTQVQIYEDSVLQNATTTAFTPVGNNRDLEMGRSWGGGSPTRYFTGLLDEVSYYGRALSASEVLGLYNAGPAGKTLAAAAPILLSGTVQNNALVLSFSATVGKSYTVQSETVLSSNGWTDLYTVVASSPIVLYTNPLTGSAQRFFRVKTSAN